MQKTSLLIMLISVVMLSGCRQSIEEKAAQEAAEYTRKYCPTPVYNNTQTDSFTYDRATRTLVYHCKFIGPMDNDSIIQANKDMLYNGLDRSIRESTSLKLYKDAGIRFKYVIRSEKNPTHVLFEATFE